MAVIPKNPQHRCKACGATKPRVEFRTLGPTGTASYVTPFCGDCRDAAMQAHEAATARPFAHYCACGGPVLTDANPTAPGVMADAAPTGTCASCGAVYMLAARQGGARARRGR
jgi:hypothetical protein